MFSRKTKKSKRNWVIAPLVVGLLGVSCFALWHALSIPSFAADPEETTEWIVVTGVSNVTEYLTSLVLYTDDPMSKTAVVLKYDADLNALIIDGAVNADALAIWSWNQIHGSGNVTLWGEKNIISNSNSNYSAIVWWKGNTINWSKSWTRSLTWSVIVWWEKNTLKNVNPNSLIIGWYLNTWDAWEYQVFLWGTWSKNTSSAKYFLVLWEGGNTVSSNSILMWGNIQGAKDGSHTYSSIFVWSDTWTFTPNYSKAFYANTSEGFWLNTSSPKLKLDLSKSGVLYIKKSGQINTNSQALWLECSKNKPDVKWTIAYIENWNNVWLCGCNGETWVPLSIDSFTQYACAKAGSQWTTNCLWNPANTERKPSNWKLRWYSDGNNWSWEWKYPNWTYGGAESSVGGDRECVYTCKAWYAPRTGDVSTNWNPVGWFTWSCVQCTEIANRDKWRTAWSWVDDCGFSCKAWYKYDQQARTCTICSIGEWTKADNQSWSCSRCEMPKGTAYVSSNSWTWGTLKDGTPYFGNFVSIWTWWNKNNCRFTCLSWFYVSYQNNSNNACVQCWLWQWSDWWSVTSCSSCTNKPSWISFKWKNYQDDTSWNQWTLWQTDTFHYTSMWYDWPTSCEWKCNANLWLVREWDSCVCSDKGDTHLEIVNWTARCVSNVKNRNCGTWTDGSVPWTGAVKWQWIVFDVWWEWNWTSWKRKGVRWKYVDYQVFETNWSLSECEWTCPKDYKRVWNNCEPPAVGVCSSSLNDSYVSESANLTNYSSTSLCDSSMWVSWTPYYKDTDYTYNKETWNFKWPEVALRAKWWRTWTCNWEVDYTAVSCVAYVAGKEEAWKCSLNQGEPACVLNSLNLHAPVLTWHSEYWDWRTWQVWSTDKWLKWKCPWQYWWEMVNCWTCDSWYTFHTWSQRCYANTRQIDCFQWTNPTTWPSKWYVHGTGIFTQSLDSSKEDYLYTPETKRTYTSNTVVKDWMWTSTCMYTCDTWYHVKDSDKHCYANSYTIEYYYDWDKVWTSTHYYDTSKSLTSASSLWISKDGYSFYGWSLADKNFERTYTDQLPVLNLTETDGAVIKLYAIMYKTVNFYSSTNKSVSKKATWYYSNGVCRVVTPSSPNAIDWWTLLGWRNDVDAKDKTVNSTENQVLNNCSTNFYAVYKRTANFYSWKNWTKSTSTQYYNTEGNYSVSIPSWIPYSITTPSWTILWRRSDTDAKAAVYDTTYTSLTSSSKDYYAVYSRILTIAYKWNGSDWWSAPSNSTNTQYFNSNWSVSSPSFVLRSNTFTRWWYSFNWWDLWAAWASYSWWPWVSDSATKNANAQWSANWYSITYTLNWWTNDSSNPSSYTIESETITLKDPTKSGYTFKWRTWSNWTTPQKGVKITKWTTWNKSYTANWTVVNYSISYDLRWGAVSSTNKTSYNIETSTFTLNNPTRSFSTFKWWTWTNLTSATSTVKVTKWSTWNRSYSATWDCVGWYVPSWNACIEQEKNYVILEGKPANRVLSTYWYNNGNESQSVEVCLNGGKYEDYLKNWTYCSNWCPYVDCYVDCIYSSEWDSVLYTCNDGWKTIPSCGTTDYEKYCSDNPWKLCYISVSDSSCDTLKYSTDTIMCDNNCWAAPYWSSAYQEITSCKSEVSYVKCDG